jgi:acetyl esterase/lipase
LDLFVPDREDQIPGTVVFVHGGGWRFGDRRAILPTVPAGALRVAALDAGLAFASVDYRLIGEANFPAQLHDIKSAIRYLRRYAQYFGIDEKRIGAWGESAGGHLVALLGLTAFDRSLEGTVGVTGESSHVSAVVDWYGVSDLVSLSKRWAGDVDGEDFEWTLGRLIGYASNFSSAIERASPVDHVTEDAPPFLLIHGVDDRVVPIQQSELLARRLLDVGANAEIICVEGADHCFVGSNDVSKIIGKSVAFLVRSLKD